MNVCVHIYTYIFYFGILAILTNTLAIYPSPNRYTQDGGTEGVRVQGISGFERGKKKGNRGVKVA